MATSDNMMSPIGGPNDSTPASPLMEEEEDELEPCRKNLDQTDNRPPNILIYAANNADYYKAISQSLKKCINPERYVIYHLSDEIAFKPQWSNNTTLLIVCGDVPTHISTSFIRFLLGGGRIFSICSDFLSVAVPLFAGTVEVQEEPVVSLSYRKWESVQLLHHQHCFHSSPTHKRFSKDMDPDSSASKSTVSVEPTHVEITDEFGNHHRLDLKILAKEDIWGAPSLLSAVANKGGGRALFSQVHLEQDPRQSAENSEELAASDTARLEILEDLLDNELGIDTTKVSKKEFKFLPAYFLGRHDVKQDILKKLEPYMKTLPLKELKRPEITLQFVESDEPMNPATAEYLPVYMNSCPNTFSTLKFYESLTTRSIGRTVLYTDIITSSMKVTAGHPTYNHGFVVVPTQQVSGVGRGGNSWLSPLGCAMFTVQLNIPLASNLGQRISFLQHLAGLAVVQAVKDEPDYSDVPLHLKWPNDVYAGNTTKIGGVIVDACTLQGEVVANIGCGTNLDNSNPTTCINEVIRDYNFANGCVLKEIEREVFLARVFNQMEKLIDAFQLKGPEYVIEEYYKHWLHGGAGVMVQSETREKTKATITGIDDFGYLQAKLHKSGSIISLQPDGNSFDMMEGLIYSKVRQ